MELRQGMGRGISRAGDWCVCGGVYVSVSLCVGVCLYFESRRENLLGVYAFFVILLQFNRILVFTYPLGKLKWVGDLPHYRSRSQRFAAVANALLPILNPSLPSIKFRTTFYLPPTYPNTIQSCKPTHAFLAHPLKYYKFPSPHHPSSIFILT